MKKIYEGRTKEDAIRTACEELNVDKDDLIVEVLEDDEPKKTMFSILDRKRVKIEVEVKKTKSKTKKTENRRDNRKGKNIDSKSLEENKVLLIKVLDEFKELFKNDEFNYTLDVDKNFINVSIEVNKNNRWIGYRGRTLNSLQNVLTAILASNFNQYVRVYVNIGNYKEERRKQLENLAGKVSKTVIKTKKKITLEPMSSYERKIVHDFIAKDDRLKSESIGEEPKRKVVISLK